MKQFRWADLEITKAGKRLLSVPMRPRKPAVDSPAESTLVEIYMDPAALADTTVTLFVADEPHGGTGYRLRMKSFLPAAIARR